MTILSDIRRTSDYTGQYIPNADDSLVVDYRLPFKFHAEGGFYTIASTYYECYGESYSTWVAYRMVKSAEEDAKLGFKHDDDEPEYDNYEDCMGQQVSATFLARRDVSYEEVKSFLDTHCPSWVEV